MAVLEGLKPERVFYYFEEICKVPHGSGNTKPIAGYLERFATEHSLKYQRDQHDNVIIYKDAAAGYENAPVVILQGHSDMVAEKTSDSLHDFEKEGLKLKIEGDYIAAENTTLGGDDGIAVAYALAVLEDKELKHPAIEVVITSNEEIGLLGAAALDASCLKGKRLINIDSEEEGILLVGCAGGLTSRSRIPVRYVEAENTCCEITISGLVGGHSGNEIHKHRANANILMGRFLYSLGAELDYDLAELAGGQKDNVITNEAKALIQVNETDISILMEAAVRFQQELRREYAKIDEGITITINNQGIDTQPVLHPVSREKVVFFLMNVPFGVQKMSGEIEGLVETSANLGILQLTNQELEAGTSVRSLIQSAKTAVADKICYLTEFMGGKYDQEGTYPAWEYNEASTLKDIMADVYKEVFGKKMEITVIHAGLECGLFFDKISGLDCVSFGPDIMDIHTTNEKLCISSVQRMWEYLIKILESMK